MGQIYNDVNVDLNEQKINKQLENFNSVTTELQYEDNIIHRENEINRLFGIIKKENYRSVLLVGDKGIGKMSIIKGFYKKLKETYDKDKIYVLDYDVLCDIVQTPNEFSEITSCVVENTCVNDNIIVINSIGHILNHRIYGNGGHSFLNKITRYIKERNMKIIVTATNNEYDYIKDEFPNSLNFFNIINVQELSKEDTIDIINNRLNDYSEYFKLNFPENVSKHVCDNADKYIKDKPFPEKSIWLFDEVCSKIKIKKEDNKKIVDIFKQITECEKELSVSFKDNDLLKCKEINDKIVNLNAKINKLNNKNKSKIDIDELDVLESIEEIVGVKMTYFDKNKTKELQKLALNIKEKVIGQDDTIDIIVKNIIRNKLGLRRSSHSMGNFIFIGSTGVGKTYLAKKIAEQLYGSEENLIRFDMSEYQSEIDVNKLLGSPPGYVGYKESGQLVKKLTKSSECVVLFDEIEKAHPKIYDVLLQFLDEGFITGSDGTKVDATKSLIIFTSNIGVKKAKEFSSSIGFSTKSSNEKHKENIIKKALNKRFSPEFLNRLDGICYFNSLDKNTLQIILNKEMDIMNENIKNICGIKIKLSKDVEDWILNNVVEEENGARPIIRYIQQNIEEELSTLIVEDSDILKSNKTCLIAYLENDKILLR